MLHLLDIHHLQIYHPFSFGRVIIPSVQVQHSFKSLTNPDEEREEHQSHFNCSVGKSELLESQKGPIGVVTSSTLRLL